MITFCKPAVRPRLPTKGSESRASKRERVEIASSSSTTIECDVSTWQVVRIYRGYTFASPVTL